MPAAAFADCSTRISSHAFASSSRSLSLRPCRLARLQRARTQQVRAAGSDDVDFDKRLDALKKGKGAQRNTKRRQEKAAQKGSESKPSAKKSPKYDFSDEQLHFESGPHKGDLAVNVALGATLLWLPLTAAAVGRGVFVKYRFTDKRISVITNAPWKKEQLDAAYQEVDDVQTVGRALGVWGDMVVTLKNGDKIEMRSLPKFMELKQYIRDRRDALADTKTDSLAKNAKKSQKGFA
ncbi:hypothetical protein ABBQ32_005405 [Trebouxia sp. C0010 RCD-2024]